MEAAARAETPGSESIRAHIAGTIWRIEVCLGDDIEVGQVVAVIESMKMELPVEAPRAGRISAIRVAQGQFVEEGDPLVDVE